MPDFTSQQVTLTGELFNAARVDTGKTLTAKNVLKDLIKIALNFNIKTLVFNFTYFSFRDAIRFPVFVKGKVRLNKTKGKIILPGNIQTGMILLGFGKVGHFDTASTRMIWDNEGEIIFRGPALLKFGTKIVVGKGALLELGEMFRISPNSCIICQKKIVFGKSCRISWDVQILDTDFHKIKSLTGEILNPPKEIIIGDHVWIGARAMILKGTRIPDDCIVASNSVLTKEIEGNHQIIAGMPAKVVRTGVTWES